MIQRLNVSPIVVGIILLALGMDGGFAESLPTNNNPGRQIRFLSPEETEDRRRQLVRFIWPHGLPIDRQPRVQVDVDRKVCGENLLRLNVTRYKQVDQINIDILGMNSLAYLLHPKKAAGVNRLAIVHEGHAPRGRPLHDGIDATIHFFLRQGFSVCIMQMPLYGWNSDETMVIAGPSKAAKAVVSVKRHDHMFDKISAHGLPEAEAMRFFLEPVVIAINYWIRTTQSRDITMVGLSGGGWTTHMSSALDPRIQLNFPVAGSYPLYLRNTDPHSLGDKEQYLAPLFDENIAKDGTGGGVCTWLEIYALGGYGTGRWQIMVTAEFDSCCFSGRHADTFKDIVSNSVKQLGQGRWEHALDSTHRGHQISPWIIENVIKTAIER